MGVVLTGAACTVLIDRSANQCRTDDDCAQYGGRPYCRSFLCVASGLEPSQCFFATPEKGPASDLDFFNQCTLNYVGATTDPTVGTGNDECLKVSNCAGAGICEGSADAGALTPPQVPDAGAPGDAGAAEVARPALPSCESAAGGSVFYITGSSNFYPLLDRLAPIVRKKGVNPVFRITDSCTGAGSMSRTAAGDFVPAHFMHDPAPGPKAIYAQYYDEKGRHPCSVGPEGVEVDIGEAEISAETCGLSLNASQVVQTMGPILAILFVVPNASSQRAISAEVARQVLGNGGVLPNGSKVTPWNDPGFFYVRGSGTATARLIGLAIGVPIPQNRLWGIDQGQADKLALNLGLVTGADAEKAIGILGADYYDQNRDTIKTLAFQAKGQGCAFHPDANSILTTSPRDKINVRDGHYPIWGTLHFFAAKGKDGSLLSDAATKFLPQFNPNAPTAPEVLDAFIDSSWVPECAMLVRRDQDLEILKSYQPSFPCGCYYESRVHNGKLPPGSTCQACQTAADCTDRSKPACNFGYCEAGKV